MTLRQTSSLTVKSIRTKQLFNMDTTKIYNEIYPDPNKKRATRHAGISQRIADREGVSLKYLQEQMRLEAKRRAAVLKVLFRIENGESVESIKKNP